MPITLPGRRLVIVGLVAGLCAGCASLESDPASRLPHDLARLPDGSASQPWPSATSPQESRGRIARLLPPALKDRAGWAADLHTAYTWLSIPQADTSYCASLAIIEQESSFQTDPAVPNLAGLVRKELEQRADRYGIPMLVINAALRKTSPDGRSYDARIDALKTEKQLNDLFDDMIGELPFGRRLLADYNPVHTAGPMQVSIDFAERQAQSKPYPYPIATTLRDEVFTRRGGLYFGAAILLDYPAPYDDIAFRFADFNAGRFASRNAAFQAALARHAGKPLTLDGDLLRYENGKPTTVPSQVETLLRAMASALRLSEPEIRRDLLLEKSAEFAQSPLYARLFEIAELSAASALPRQVMPAINLKSPKITRKLTTEWFARRVAERYRKCLARAGPPPPNPQ